MSKPDLRKLLETQMTRKQFLAFSAFAIASVFGLVGLIRLLASHAATPTASIEPENGTLGGTTKVTDSTASGGNAIKFGGGSSRDQLDWPYMPTPKVSVGVLGSSKSEYPDYNIPDTQTLILDDTFKGHTFEKKTIYGEIRVQTTNVTFKDCILRGPMGTPANETAVVNCHSPLNDNCQIIDCTIAPQWPNQNLDAIKGHRFKAVRVHSFWVVDGFGVFNADKSSGVPNTRDTGVEIYGCRVEQLAYFHGPNYCDRNAYLLTTAGNYVDKKTTGVTFVTRPSDAWTDNGHPDGNHSDSIEIQGGYGYNTENADGSWSGTGINVYHNYFRVNVAKVNATDPSGLGFPVPGQTGSRSGSRLGTHDNGKLTAQNQNVTVPIVTPGYATAPFFDGEWPAVGSAVIAVQNLNQYPYPTVGDPTKWTVTIWENLLDDYGIGLNVQQKNYSTVSMVFLRNEFTRNVYRYSSTSTYPMDFPNRSAMKIRGVTLGKDFNTAGTNTTNVWRDSTNTWGANGAALYESSNGTGKSSTTGIVFRAE